MKRSPWPRAGVIVPLFLTIATASSPVQQGAAPRPAVPVEPITAILGAFRSHQVVALGEGAHGNEQGHAFRLSLIRDRRFAATVNDIVVEFGSAGYQDLMDRFVRGDEVPDEALRQVWRNTTQPHTVWDTPIYEEFFRAVRAVNASLPPERQLRVLLGDPPIDWDGVHNFEDLRKSLTDPMADRNPHPADVIRREVLAKQRRALVIYGDAHLFRIPMRETIVSLLESTAATKVFTISSPISMPTAKDLETLQADVASWRVPSMAIVRGTVLGATDFTFYYPPPMMIRDGKPVPVPPDQSRSLRMEDQFDALLYLGHPSSITMTRLSPQRCSDAVYMEMRLRRMALSPLGQGQVDRLKQYCATVAPK